MHELSLSGAIVNTVVKHAQGRPVSVVSLRVGALRQVVPDTLDFYFGFVARGTVCEGARLEQELIPARLRCARVRARVGDRAADLHVPGLRRRGPGRGGERRRVRGGVDRGRGGRMHRTKVKIVEEALDANNTIAQANRADFDRAGVRVINFMSAPGRGQDRAARARGGATCPACASACSRATCRGRWTPTGWRRCTCRSRSSTPIRASAASATSTRTWSARRCPSCRSTTSTCS